MQVKSVAGSYGLIYQRADLRRQKRQSRVEAGVKPGQTVKGIAWVATGVGQRHLIVMTTDGREAAYTRVC